ncbi:MAG: hypothetical protein NT027_17295 [Proteobacteria bacterium]|nr:hypothetical protein [Pseudomonadota bacterium]
MSLRKTLVIMHIFWTVLSCASTDKENRPYGIQPSKIGYIPARMGVAPCLPWPAKLTKIKGMPLGNLSAQDTSLLCQDFDAFIASSFDNQPFMKGLSTKFVEKLMVSANMKSSIAESISEKWQHQSTDCNQCSTLSSFYIESIAHRKDWQIWLAQFSAATKGADAILIPLILHYSKENVDDRGMTVAKRFASAALLLVDTSSGELIWSGGRDAEVVNKTYGEDPKAKSLDPPNQEELRKRLFTDVIWLAFPGRQIYK